MRIRPLRFAALLLFALLLFTGCGKAQTQAGTKAITVDITMPDGVVVTFAITTEAEYLRGALEQENLIAGDEGPYGLFLKTVNGYTVDEAKQEWWSLTKGGETLFTGVDSTPIADGEQYEITLTVGY